MLLQDIPGSGEKNASWWKAAVSNEFSLEPLIRNEKSITGAVKDPLLQSPASHSKEDLQILRSDLVLTVFQDFIGHSQNKFAEMQEHAQKEGTILSVAMVDGRIVTVTQLFTYSEICEGHRQKLCSNH